MAQAFRGLNGQPAEEVRCRQERRADIAPFIAGEGVAQFGYRTGVRPLFEETSSCQVS